MGYYVRVLGTSDPNIHLDDIISGLTDDGLNAIVEYNQDESPDIWSELRVTNINGDNIMLVERNPVIKGELGMDELEEFREEIIDCKPSSAVKWLNKYFDKVKVIYAFQLLNDAFEDDNFPIVSSIKSTIWDKTGGIVQADDEGFSNEEGYHILWQFSDEVTGEWNMSALNFWGKWTNFVMDLGDKKQREEFWNGNVPKTATRL